MKKEMLINVLQPEECRIAIIENGVLEELYVERTSQESYVGNIYKGRIVNIEPSIQAAFVDFGIGRNGFLHVSDVDPAYYKHLEGPRGERRDRDDRRGGRGNGRGGRGRRDDRPERSRPPEPEPAPFRDEDYLPPDALLDAPPARESAPPAEDSGSVWGAAVEILGLDMPAAPPAAPPGAEPQRAPEPARDADEMPAGAAPASAAPAEEPVDEGRRGRGRGRGRGRNGEGRGRRRPRRGDGDAERQTPNTAEAAPEPPPAPEAPPPDDDKPRFMTSAERRTTDDDEPFGAGIFSDPLPSREPAPSARDARPADLDEPPAAEEFAPLIEEPRAEAGDVAGENDDFDAYVNEALAETGVAVPDAEIVEEEFPTEEPVDDLEDDEFLDMELEDGEVPQPRSRPRDRDRGDRDRRGGRGRGGPRRGGRPGSFGRPKPLIQDIFKRGQEVIVQVIKEGIGTKGPTLSTYVSIAGRYLVLMPGLNRIGVSRKIQDDDARRRLKEILCDLQPPKGIGFIIRTAGIDRNKKELQNDLAYLLRLWQVMVRRIRKLKAPAEIYQESDMITRTIRDTFTSDIDTIWVDEPNAFAHAQEFLQIVMPRYADRIKHFDDIQPLFHKYRIEDEIIRIQQRKIPLSLGGSIVIEQTEALVAIDVNSGNFRADNNAEETAYQMNLQAAKEIARQLRLRDLGGVIVNDFIDMREEKHKRGVEKALRDALRRDRARTKILKISQFGLIEMTRQRIRPSLKRSIYHECPACSGNGLVKTVESMSIDVMRLLQLAAHREGIQRIQVRVHPEVAYYLLNRKRKEVAQLEQRGEMQVVVFGVFAAPPELLEVSCFDRNNNEVKFLPVEPPPRLPERDRGRRNHR